MFLRQIVFSSFFFALAANSASTASAQGSLDDVVEAYESLVLELSPDLRAAEKGVAPSTWGDVTPEGLAEAQAAMAALADELAAIDQSGYSETERMNHAILAAQISDLLLSAEMDDDRARIGGHTGFQLDVTYGMSRVTIRNEADVVATIARLNAVPAYFADIRANLERGLAEGFVAYEDPLTTTMEQISAQVDAPIEETDFYTPFLNLPDNVAGASLDLGERFDVAGQLQGFHGTSNGPEYRTIFQSINQPKSPAPRNPPEHRAPTASPSYDEFSSTRPTSDSDSPKGSFFA